MNPKFGIRCDHSRRELIKNQVGEIIAWSCNSCPATGQNNLPVLVRQTPASALPTTVPFLSECDWCGESLDTQRTGRFAKERWLFKRYCDKTCYSDDLEDRRETGRAISNRDALERGFAIKDLR